MAKRVLLVNAEVAERRRHGAALREAGFEIVECGGGLDALVVLNTYSVEGRPVAAMLLGDALEDLGGEALLRALWSRWPEFPVCTTSMNIEADGLTRCEDLDEAVEALKARALDAPDAPNAVYLLARFDDPMAALERLKAQHPLCHAVRDARAQLLLRVEAGDGPALEAAIAEIGAASVERFDVVPVLGFGHLREWLEALDAPQAEARPGDVAVDWLIDCTLCLQPLVYAHLRLLGEVARVDALAGGRLIATARGPKARLEARLQEVVRRPGVGRVREMKVIGDL